MPGGHGAVLTCFPQTAAARHRRGRARAGEIRRGLGATGLEDVLFEQGDEGARVRELVVKNELGCEDARMQGCKGVRISGCEQTGMRSCRLLSRKVAQRPPEDRLGTCAVA
eukprot:1126329-Rhodomonas_salina.2